MSSKSVFHTVYIGLALNNLLSDFITLQESNHHLRLEICIIPSTKWRTVCFAKLWEESS